MRRATINRADAEAVQFKGPHSDIRNATIKRAEAEAIHIKSPQKEDKGNKKQNGCQMLYRSRARREGRSATINRADAEPIRLKGP